MTRIRHNFVASACRLQPACLSDATKSKNLRAKACTPKRAFTLLELILVLVILCTAMALAAPKLSGWSRRTKLRNSAQDFISATKFARVNAVANGAMYRLVVDRQTNVFAVLYQVPGQDFVPAQSDYGRGIGVPEGAKIEMTGPAGQVIDTIYFYPTGRVDPAQVRIGSEDGEVDIACASPAEDFVILNGQEQSR
jgi:prepilin-type N-terminal cleavage/methylation domain-containing protein